MRALTLAIVCLLSLLGPAAADDEKNEPKEAPPKPLTTEQAADAVLKAVKNKDDKTLSALAGKDNPDPWLVADELCYRGEHDVAELFAKAAPRVDVERLPAYVEAWRKRAPDKEDRELLSKMNAATRAKEPQKVLDGTAALTEPLGTVVRIRLGQLRVIAFYRVRRFDESASMGRKAAYASRTLGWLRRSARLYAQSGESAYHASKWPDSLADRQARLAIEERRGNKAGVADTNVGIGNNHLQIGDYAQALAHYKRAHAAMEALPGNADMVTKLAANIGLVHFSLGDYPKALAMLEPALAAIEALGNQAGAAWMRGHIGSIHFRLGDYAKALANYKHAHGTLKALGDKAGEAETLSNIGLVHLSLGNYAKALAIHERAYAADQAQGNKAGAAISLGHIGNVHSSLGDFAKALAIFERAFAAAEALSDKLGVAGLLVNIGNCHHGLGDYPKALATYERALAAKEALGDKYGVALAIGVIGNVHRDLGNSAKALAHHERALAAKEALGDKVGVAYTLCNIGGVYNRLGDYAKARQFLKRSASAARSLRALPLRVSALEQLARLHLDAGSAPRALSAAQRVLREMESLLGGLGEEQGATAREQHASIFAVGALAAAREEDPAEALTFLESGRAGALLDALDKRETLRWKAESLQPDLLRADREAQGAENVARHGYDRAVRRGVRREIRTAATTLDDATQVVRAVAGRVQRALKQQAGLFYPRPKTLYNIQDALEADQALVLYGLCLDEALALVVRHDGERIVSLGTVTQIEAACSALDASDSEVDPTKALAALQAQLVDPLKLDKDVKQVLISPEGALCYVPFGSLFSQTVCMTPSGTTHLLLLDEEREPGKGVLALGNPDYGGVSGGAKAIYYRGRTLSPLPATGPEATQIGTVSLVGAKASEAGFREAVSKTKRWKAVHFACHGLIDVERPMLSSLALSLAGEDDGFLTALEVLRMEVPADLAVLSACETGKGKIVKGEGIVGLTRAFMFAGAPRVICSLWKVDDEATKALMIKFYELWNPKEGRGLGAAAALQKAQAFVRDQKSGKWKHPYYWAAWVLWGLPE